MNGNTGVTSNLGSGSTFWFECKVDIVDDGITSIESIKHKKIGIYTKDQLTKDFLSAHFENWTCNTVVIDDLNQPENIDYLFLDHESLNTQTKDDLCKTFSLKRERLIDIGNFDSDAILRLPLTSAALYKSMQSKDETKPAGEQIAVSHDNDLPLNGLNILVAEDNSVNQMVIQALLKKLGAESKIYENGLLAYEALKSQPNNFDIVLMDCEMPIMDGFSTTEKIRASENDSLKTIPIIALTAHAMDFHKVKAREAGMDSFLSKPIKRQALIQTIIDTITNKAGLL